jgi:hypothetical protein
MPDSGRQLSRKGVSQVKAFGEGGHARRMRVFADVGVSPFCRVPKKGGVAQGWAGLPVPFPRIPGKILDETSVVDSVKESLLSRCRGVPGDLESGPGVLL